MIMNPQESRYENHSVVERICKDEGLAPGIATASFREMLRFLDVCAMASAPVSPSKLIDAAWHAFILHTRDYADYCEGRFGRFIHHQPTRTGNLNSYLRARALAEEFFGSLDERFWPARERKVAACHDPDGECAGPCESGSVPIAIGDCMDSDCHDDGHCDGS